MIIAVDHFGAVGDGETDDSGAIQAAINSAPDECTIHFPAGKYLISAPLNVIYRVGLTFTGKQATITGGRLRLSGFFMLNRASRIHFSGLAFDQCHSKLPVYNRADYGSLYNCAISMVDCRSIEVTQCRFTNLYTSAIYAFQCISLKITESKFLSPQQQQDQWLQHVHLQTCAGLIVIIGNSFKNIEFENPAFGPCAIFASGIVGSIEIRKNRLDFCGRNNTGNHRLGVIDFYGDVQNVVVSDNIATNCMAQFSRISSALNVKIEYNEIEINKNAEFDYSTITVESTIAFSPGISGANNVLIANNTFRDQFGRAAFTVGAIAYDWGAPLRNIAISGNKFFGVRRSIYVAGPFLGVNIEANTIYGRPGTIEVNHNNPINLTSKTGQENAAIFDKLTILGNVYKDRGSKQTHAVFINLQKSPRFSGLVGTIIIADNHLELFDIVETAAVSITIGATILQGAVSLINNQIINFATGFEVRGVNSVSGIRNRFIGHVGELIVNDGSNGVVSIS